MLFEKIECLFFSYFFNGSKAKSTAFRGLFWTRLPQAGSAMVLLGASIFEQMKELAPELLSWVYSASDELENHPT